MWSDAFVRSIFYILRSFCDLHRRPFFEESILIETLAEEIAALLLKNYLLAAVEIELRKYILPDTEFVAVRLRREA